VTHTVVEVGPVMVRGPRHVPQELVSTALECIDDTIAVLDQEPVELGRLWREVFRAVLPDRVETAVLVCPTWWPPPRVECVREAATAHAAEVVVLQRAEVLAGDGPGAPAVVEIAPEFVVVSRAGEVVGAEARAGASADIASWVSNCVGPATVLVDAPVGVTGGAELASAVSQRLRAVGAAVTTVHRDRVLVGPREHTAPRILETTTRMRSRVLALAAVFTSVTLVCIGLAVVFGSQQPRELTEPMTLLVEGRVGVKVPALWAVQRITWGPGSARVQVTAPDKSTALLVTQALVAEGETLSATSATLRAALDDQQAGVFSLFNPDDVRAGRHAATYRELRDRRQIAWAVFLDGSVRIGLGCQSAPGGEQLVRDVCDEAIRSAHALV
jgi:type VII secretion-associated protein (TIGR03931 family)